MQVPHPYEVKLIIRAAFYVIYIERKVIIEMFLKSIRFKLSLALFIIVAALASASLMIVTEDAKRTSLDDLLSRGHLLSDATARAFEGRGNISRARLWSELRVKFTEHAEDTLFMAAVDSRGIIRAHTLDFLKRKPFEPVEGKTIEIGEDGSEVREVLRAGVRNYEFKRPILINGRRAGDLYIALDAIPVDEAGRDARKKILLISAAALASGIPLMFLISSAFTSPLRKLAEGINMLPTAGEEMEEIKAPSTEETGELIRRFNRMSKTILEQKRELKENSRDIEESYVATLRLLATVIDARDKYTRGHSARVARLSMAMGRRMGLEEAETKDLEISSMFHDVGKIRVPDSILNKDEPLSKEEFTEMMQHTRIGARILEAAPSLHKHMPAALYHHERFDGSGYPDGLKGDEIPVAATIISIADAFDAMTTSRPYRPAMTHDEAVAEIMRCKGTQFHPLVAEEFLELLRSPELNTLRQLEGYFSDISL
jgi:HD-GYP domain-containing protein (c-di-GMP phosphodiesterase class II)